MSRALDLALLAAASPLLVPLTGGLALAVLAADGRPVLFRQERLGRDREPFTVLKLRTMTTEPDPEERRPTRLGAWLRARGLDELPQLINVARGDMAIVGPRPHTRADAERLSAKHAPYSARFGVRPGLTGLAQVHQAVGVEANAALDREYVQAPSAVEDLRILARTAWMNAVGKARGRARRAIRGGGRRGWAVLPWRA